MSAMRMKRHVAWQAVLCAIQKGRASHYAISSHSGTLTCEHPSTEAYSQAIGVADKANIQDVVV
jgi:hypothetical protein